MLIHMNHYFSGTAPSPAYRAACGNHRDNAATAKRAGVKTLVLTHVLPQIDQPRIREQIIHEIQKEFEGKVIWGEDLMRLTHEQSITIRDPETVNRQLDVVSAEVQATDETVREMERFLDFQDEVSKPRPHGTRVR